MTRNQKLWISCISVTTIFTVVQIFSSHRYRRALRGIGMNSKPTVYTFYHEISFENNDVTTASKRELDRILLRMWKDEWTSVNMEARILTIDDARQHSHFFTVDRMLKDSQLKDYDYFNLMQWLAMANQPKGGILTTYDTFPLAMNLDVLPNRGRLTIFESEKTGGIPPLISGSQYEWFRLAWALVENAADRGDEIDRDITKALQNLQKDSGGSAYVLDARVLSGETVLHRKGYSKETCDMASKAFAVQFSSYAIKNGILQQGVINGIQTQASTAEKWLEGWRKNCDIQFASPNMEEEVYPAISSSFDEVNSNSILQSVIDIGSAAQVLEDQTGKSESKNTIETIKETEIFKIIKEEVQPATSSSHDKVNSDSILPSKSITDTYSDASAVESQMQNSDAKNNVKASTETNISEVIEEEVYPAASNSFDKVNSDPVLPSKSFADTDSDVLATGSQLQKNHSKSTTETADERDSSEVIENAIEMNHPTAPREEKPVIFTFYGNMESSTETEIISQNGKKMIEAWALAWSEMGWDPRVLDFSVARKHHQFNKFDKIIKDLPFENFDRISFYRYLAAGMAGGGWVSDFDVYPLIRAKWQGKGNPEFLPNDGNLTVYELSKSNGLPIPSLMSGNEDEWFRLAKSQVANARKHKMETKWNDMDVMQDLYKDSNGTFFKVQDNVILAIQKKEITKDHCAKLSSKLAVHFPISLMTESPGLMASERVKRRVGFERSWFREYYKVCIDDPQ